MRDALRRLVATNGVGRVKWRRAGAVSLLASASAASCNFPNYGFDRFALGTAGGAGAGASGALAAFGGDGGSASGGGQGGSTAGRADGGAGNSGVAGGDEESAGAAGNAGDAGAQSCVVAIPEPLPPTCSNGTLDGDETGIDCGGRICHPCFHSEACVRSQDCISGECTGSVCTPLVQLETQAIVRTSYPYALQFRFRVHSLATTLPLKSLSIRYYFGLGAVAEPVVPTSTQAVLDGSMDIAGSTHWDIVHVLPASENASTNAYLEVTFDSSLSIAKGKVLDLTQSIQAANASSMHTFDQGSHYSYIDSDSYKPNEHATVYYSGELAWGTPPAYGVASGCFYTAVHFGGGPLTIEGRQFLGSDDPSIVEQGMPLQVDTTPFPTPAPAYLPLLQAVTVLDTEHAKLAVPNGSYWVYPYVVSAGGTNQASLLVQGVVADLFVAGTLDGAPTWAKLGPYSVSVSDETLDFSASGGPIRLAGVEVFQQAK